MNQVNNLPDRGKRGIDVVPVKFERNTSGWEALDYKCFVVKDEIQELTGGGLIAVPQDVLEEEKWNINTGVLVSHGDLAFTQGRKPNGDFYHWDRRPKVGDRVMVKEFSGMKFIGDDGIEYYVFTDKDITGAQIS